MILLLILLLTNNKRVAVPRLNQNDPTLGEAKALEQAVVIHDRLTGALSFVGYSTAENSLVIVNKDGRITPVGPATGRIKSVLSNSAGSSFIINRHDNSILVIDKEGKTNQLSSEVVLADWVENQIISLNKKDSDSGADSGFALVLNNKELMTISNLENPYSLDVAPNNQFALLTTVIEDEHYDQRFYYLINLGTGTSKKISDIALSATWTSDGQFVIFDVFDTGTDLTKNTVTFYQVASGQTFSLNVTGTDLFVLPLNSKSYLNLSYSDVRSGETGSYVAEIIDTEKEQVIRTTMVSVPVSDPPQNFLHNNSEVLLIGKSHLITKQISDFISSPWRE